MSRQLTDQMIADFAPYLKDPEEFRAAVYEKVSRLGEIDRVETILENGLLVEKDYYFHGFTFPTYVLDTLHAGVGHL